MPSVGWRGRSPEVSPAISRGGHGTAASCSSAVGPFHDDDLRRCLGPVGLEAARRRPPETPVEQIRDRFDERRPGGDQLAWMSYLALKTDLVEDYLVRLDTMGMGESVEGRVPLLDADLVRFGLSLPQKTKIGSHYEQKALFRRAVSTFLPGYIVERPKQGFCPPVADWAPPCFEPASGIGRLSSTWA